MKMVVMEELYITIKMKKDINIESINNKKVENSKDGYRPDFLINNGTMIQQFF